MSERLFNPAQLSVLLVDDHDPIRKSLRRVVESMGFVDVVECTGGTEAIKLLSKRPIDLLISDLFMRQGSGFDLLEFIRNREVCADIPVLIVTGEASKEEIVKVADMGAEDYLLKPFQTADLEKKIVRILSKYFSPSPLLQVQRRAERNFIQGQFKEALATYEQAATLDANSPRTLHGKAITLVKMGQLDEALSVLLVSADRNFSYHRNYATLADIYLKLNKVGEAIGAMKKELEINAKQLNRQTQLGMLLLKEGDALGAIDHFRIALQEDPKLISALMGMGQAFAIMSNVDKSLYYFKRVRRYHPQATKALEAAVKVAVGANEPRKAEMFLKDEKAVHPELLDTYIILGLFYLRYDRDDEALALAQSMLEKDPDQIQALKIMSMVYLKQKDLPNASMYLDRLAKLSPTPETLLQLGEVYLGMQKVPEATASLMKALSLKPDSAPIIFALAETHKRSQQWIKALLLYQKGLKMGANKELCTREITNCLNFSVARRQRPKVAS